MRGKSALTRPALGRQRQLVKNSILLGGETASRHLRSKSSREVLLPVPESRKSKARSSLGTRYPHRQCQRQHQWGYHGDARSASPEFEAIGDTCDLDIGLGPVAMTEARFPRLQLRYIPKMGVSLQF